jgi:hypothetical protein
MTTFYKATRLDGTDFRTSRVQYTVGKRVRPLPFEGERELCGEGYLHASDVPAETLVGGSWPCRLFEVTGKPFASDDWHKHGFRQLTVVHELDSHLALGPNGREVAALIDRAGRLTPEESEALGAARAAPLAAYQRAPQAAAWSATWSAARNAARIAAWDVAGKVARDAAGNAARNAAWNAASALVVRDLITPEQFDLLYGPWRDVIG